MNQWILGFDADSGTITSFKKDLAGKLSIDENYQGVPVKKIGTNACYECMIEELDISQTKIDVIELNAFAQCNFLKKISFPNYHVLLEGNSFLRVGIIDLYIPELLVGFTGYAFNQCPNLTTINVDENNKIFSALGNCLFSKNYDKLIKVANYVTEIPNFHLIQTIGEFAFAGSQSYLNFQTTSNLSNIEQYSFHAAQNLKIINLSISSITIIPSYTFGYVPSLVQLILPHGIKEIRKNSIYYTKIRTLIIPYSVTKIETNSISLCPYLKTILYAGNTYFSKVNIVTQCDKVSQVRVTFDYPNSLFSNLPVIPIAYDYGVLDVTPCPTPTIQYHPQNYLLIYVIIY